MDDGGMSERRNWDDNVKEEEVQVELFEFALEAKAKVTVFLYSARTALSHSVSFGFGRQMFPNISLFSRR